MGIPVSSPSAVEVVDRDSLGRNFAENATNVVCQAAIGAGTYSIAGKLLGFAKVNPTVGVLSVGAMVAAMALCPSGASQSAIFGRPSPGVGGQCPVLYNIEYGCTYYASQSGQTTPLSAVASSVLGPLKITSIPPEGLQSTSDPNRKFIVLRGNGTQGAGFSAPWGMVPGTFFVRYVRVDGLPDNCGNQGNIGGQVNRSVTDGDTFYDNSVTDNSNNVYVAPVKIRLGNINQTVNLPFSNVRIGSLFPMEFSIDIGGVRYGFEEDDTHRIVPKKEDPDPESPGSSSDSLKKIYEKLGQIKDCVCAPEVDLDLLYVPFVDASVDCQVETASLLVPRGSVSPSLVTKLNASTELARQKCLEEEVVQLPQSLIYSASTTVEGRELFSGEIPPEVVSLRLSITEVREDGPPIISIYPEAKQRKFGSVSFVLESINGGGDYVYVFDQETYLPLPKRGKKGKLRLLLKGGLSFNLYDTGERL